MLPSTGEIPAVQLRPQLVVAADTAAVGSSAVIEMMMSSSSAVAADTAAVGCSAVIEMMMSSSSVVAWNMGQRSSVVATSRVLEQMSVVYSHTLLSAGVRVTVLNQGYEQHDAPSHVPSSCI